MYVHGAWPSVSCPRPSCCRATLAPARSLPGWSLLSSTQRSPSREQQRQQGRPERPLRLVRRLAAASPRPPAAASAKALWTAQPAQA